MSIETKPGLIDYWHDLYMHEVIVRHNIMEVLQLTVSNEEKLAEIDRIAHWRLPRA